MLVIKWELVIKIKTIENMVTKADAQEVKVVKRGMRDQTETETESGRMDQRTKSETVTDENKGRDIWESLKSFFLRFLLKNLIKESWTPEWERYGKRNGELVEQKENWGCSRGLRQRQGRRNIETEMENNAVCVCVSVQRETEMQGRGTKMKQETRPQKKSHMRSRFEAKSHKIEHEAKMVGERYMKWVGISGGVALCY